MAKIANPYESGEIKVIPAVLVYLMYGDKVLMLRRLMRAGDIHSGKYNGLGGKLDALESPAAAASREVQEECGLNIPYSRYESAGYMTFPMFKAVKKEDWNVYLFTARLKQEELGSIWQHGPEGDLQWIDINQVMELNLWPGDRYFLPYVLQGQIVSGTIWYKDGKVTDQYVVAK